MNDGKKGEVMDWANPAVRPGLGIYGRQQHRANTGFIGMLKGSLLSERQQEIYYYVLFGMCFSIAWFIDRPGQQSYFLADRVRMHFLAPSFRPDLADALVDHDYERLVAWGDINSVEELWGWMEGPLLAATYDEDTPRSGVGNVLGYAGLANGMRVRQVRVKPQPCKNMPEWARLATTQEGGFNGTCYPTLGMWNEDTSSFGPTAASSTRFSWQKSSEWAMPTTTIFGRYSEHGFLFDMPSFNKSRARDIVRTHRKDLFLDLQTRAVFIDATFFHPSMERFVTMRLLAEVPESGGVETSSHFIATRVNSYPGILGMVQLFIEAVFVVQLCGFVFMEMMKVRKVGILYIKQFWGMVILTQGVLLLFLIGFRVTTFQALMRQNQEWNVADPNEYIDMQVCVWMCECVCVHKAERG